MMKKLSAILIASLIVYACTPKATPTTTTASTPTTETKAEVETSTKTPEPNTAITAGHTIYTTKCSKCHAAKEVTAYDAKSWEGILKSMIPKAKLNDEEAKNVTAYVMANAKK